MDNMTYAIEDFRRRNSNRYASEDIHYYLPSQEEDVFSFKHLQLHQHKKKISNRQKQQSNQRPSTYEKIIAELSQNSNSDHLQLVGSSQGLDTNIETERLSFPSMSGNNSKIKRHLSDPAERFSTYDRIVQELSTERSISSDGSMSVIGGRNADNRSISEDGTGVFLNDYGQLPTKEFTDVSQESHAPRLVIPNFATLDMLNEETNSRDTVQTEASGMHFYPSKEVKNYVNNRSKLQAEGAYDDYSLIQEKETLPQNCDQDLLYQVSSMNIHPTSLSSDKNNVNNQLRGLTNGSLDSNIRLYESNNQHIGSSLSDQGNQNDINSYNLISSDNQVPYSCKYNSGSHSTLNSSELSNKQYDQHNTKEKSSISLLGYLSPATNDSWANNKTSQNFCEYDGTNYMTESSSKDWGVSGAIRGIITGVFGEKATQTSPKRAQQVKEIADLNTIFRY